MTGSFDFDMLYGIMNMNSDLFRVKSMIDRGEMINHFRGLYIDRGGYPRKTLVRDGIMT